jgi:hypothetical protein
MKKQTLATIAILALGLVCAMWSTGEARYRYGRNYNNQYDQYGRYQSYRSSYQGRVLIPAGTSMNVRLDTQVSTENAQSGDTWSGTVSQSVIAGNRVVIPAGTPVEGVVTSSTQGTHDNRPELSLAIRRVTVDGRTQAMNADTQPIVAGSNRAKKLGVIAGGAAAGALLGHAVARGEHGTLIGGILGGAAGYGLSRHALRTMQLKPGTVLTFTTRGDVLAYR